jgi:hypothetical protein
MRLFRRRSSELILFGLGEELGGAVGLMEGEERVVGSQTGLVVVVSEGHLGLRRWVKASQFAG